MNKRNEIKDLNCKYCGSENLRPLDDERPCELAALHDGYKYECEHCRKLN